MWILILTATKKYNPMFTMIWTRCWCMHIHILYAVAKSIKCLFSETRLGFLLLAGRVKYSKSSFLLEIFFRPASRRPPLIVVGLSDKGYSIVSSLP